MRDSREIQVLVVDDDLALCELLRTTFELEGIKILEAHHVIEAERLLIATRPDAIVLDIGLPGVDGYEVARRIRTAKGADAPRLIAITGYGREEDRERTRAAGFTAHLVKPVNFEALRRLLADLH